jgi:hypothetical protein
MVLMDLSGLKMGWLLWSFLDSKWASSSGFYRPRNSVVSMAYQALGWPLQPHNSGYLVEVWRS